ncbi:hypothetical protein Tco_0121137 [Tanacetum coccineum]
MVKLTTFAVMCRAYGGEPTINLLHSFLNLGRAGDWLTLSNRGSADVPIALVKPITHLANWKEMDFRSFMMQEIDGEFKFLPEGCIDDNQGSPSSKSVNNEAPVIDAKPLTSLHPPEFVEDVVDSDDASAGDNENPLLGTSLPPLPEAGKKLRSLGKRKLPSGVGDSLPKVQNMAAQASKVAGEASDPLDVDSDANIYEFPLAKELKDSADCHCVVAHVTPTSWKEHLRNLRRIANMLSWNEALLDLDKNPLVVDMRTKIETLQGRSKIEGLESERERERLKLSEIQLLQGMDALKQDRASVIATVVPDAATKLIRSDEMGMLVAKLVKASIMHGRCAAFEEVAKLKEPFVIEKKVGYHPSSKQEYDQARDDLANTSYPFLSKFVNDPYASLEQLLSKKPESLHSKPLYVKAK